MKKILHEIASRGGKLWFAVAACAVLAAAAALSIDQAAAAFVRSVVMGKPPIIVHVVSNLGEWDTPAFIFVVLIVLYGEERTGVGGLLGMTGAGLAADVVKELVPRIRPDGGPYSFLSGHTTCAFAAAVVLAHRWPKRWYVFYLLAAAVAVARVTLLKHFPSDVLAGAALGMVLGLTGLVVAEKIKFPSDPVVVRRAKAILAVLLVMSLIVSKYWAEPVAMIAAPAALLVLARRTTAFLEPRLSHDDGQA